MTQEMERIGQMFRKKREELHLTLREAEANTSIRAGYLQAIEEGKIFEFISKVYAQGFLKQYASFLELDFETIMNQYPAVLEGPQKEPEPLEFSFGIGTLETRGSLGGGVKWLPSLLWALGAAALIVFGYTTLKALGIL